MNYDIKQISHELAKPFLLHRHYARRVPAMSFSFGLYYGTQIVGVCVFGSPANRSSNMIAGYKGIELVRLFIEDFCEKIQRLFSYLGASRCFQKI